jgi:hypothetical protein
MVGKRGRKEGRIFLVGGAVRAARIPSSYATKTTITKRPRERQRHAVGTWLYFDRFFMRVDSDGTIAARPICTRDV